MELVDVVDRESHCDVVDSGGCLAQNEDWNAAVDELVKAKVYTQSETQV